MKRPTALLFRAGNIVAKILLACFVFLAVCAPPALAISLRPQAAAQKPATPPLDPASFAAELRRLEAELLGGTGSKEYVESLLHALPPSWTVDTPERRYEISSEPLRSLLQKAAGDAAQREKLLEEASAWAEDAATQVEGFDSASSDPSAQSDVRAKLGQILKRKEFAPPSPPTPLDLLRRRISEWLNRMIEKLFENISRYPLSSRALFWLIIFGVVCWLVTMLVQFWTRRARTVGLQSIASVAPHRSWQEWFRAAQEAAMRGEFRDAIHSLYWVGITRLEDLSILTVDHTRTPREQLNLLTSHEPLNLRFAASDFDHAPAAATAEQRERLAGLVSQLERVWYGHRPARIEDFRECLKHVEDLGCR